MALVVDSYRPSYADVARFAREGAAGIAARENRDRSIGRQQEQQQFDAQIQQRYDAMGQQSMESAADRRFAMDRMDAQRQFEMQRMGLGAQLEAEQQSRANSEWERRSRIQMELENQQEEFQYSTRQQAELRRIDERMVDAEKMLARGDLSPEEAQHAMYQLRSQRLGIQPREPKPRAMDEYPKLTLADGTEAWVVPGRNGAPSFRDIKTGEDVDERTSHQYRIKEIEAQNIVKRDMAEEAYQFKAAETEQQMRFEQQKTAQQMQADLRSEWVKLQSEKVKVRAQLLKEKDKDLDLGTEKPRYSPEEIDTIINNGFREAESELRNAMKAPHATGGQQRPPQPQAPVRVHSSRLTSIESQLAPGQSVVVVDENGDAYRITGNAN